MRVFQQQTAAVARADAVTGEMQNVVSTRFGAQTAREDFQLRFVFKIGGDAPLARRVVDRFEQDFLLTFGVQSLVVLQIERAGKETYTFSR